MQSDESIKIKNALQAINTKAINGYDLFKLPEAYPAVIPVLIKLLQDGINDDRNKEGIIRALAVKGAKGLAGKILINEFYKIPKEKMLLRWAIGNTIEVTITEDLFQDVVDIVTDKSNGIARQMFVLSLGKIKSKDSENVLIDLLCDDDVNAHAITALCKLKSLKAINSINKLLEHPSSFVRRTAIKALKKLEQLSSEKGSGN